MAGRKDQAILQPRTGMRILEDDTRGSLPKTIVALDEKYVYCRSGNPATGRKSRVLRRRLAEGRYKLLSWDSPGDRLVFDRALTKDEIQKIYEADA